MSTVRLRRLTADFTQLDEYAKAHPRLRLIQAEGEPPEKYQLEYRIRSLRQVGEELQEVKSHIVEITLPRSYPRVPPQCRMLSPVFHPNIAPHAICVGDHWSAGESLQAIVIRIGEMLAYQSYNVKSPLNGEAARWVAEHADELPLDDVSLLVEEVDEEQEEVDDSPFTVVEAPAPRQLVSPPPSPIRRPEPVAVSPPPLPVSAPTAAPEKIPTVCTQCGAKYRVAAAHLGRSVECKACGESFVIA